jgi:hypothetical protein
MDPDRGASQFLIEFYLEAVRTDAGICYHFLCEVLANYRFYLWRGSAYSLHCLCFDL